MPNITRISRRNLLLASGLAMGGGALFAFTRLIPNEQSRLNANHAGSGQHFLTSFVRMQQNIITVLVPHVDMGHGIHTSLAMMLAEEMDADWSQVEVEQAPADDLFSIHDRFRFRDGELESAVRGLLDQLQGESRNGLNQTTAGSSSVRYTGDLAMRTSGAAIRAMLLAEASEQLQVPLAALVAAQSRVQHPESGRILSYGQLAERASVRSPPAAPPLKRTDQFSLTGTSPPRLDIPDKAIGATRYGIDVLNENTLRAALRLLPPGLQGVAPLNREAIRRLQGVVDIVELPDAIAVIANNTWRAQNALRQLQYPEPGVVSAREALSSGAEIQRQRESLESASPAPGSPGTHFNAQYQVPYLAHAAMEPMNCTVAFSDQAVEVWCGSQDPLALRDRVAALAGLNPDQVKINTPPLGGAFGRRLPGNWNVIDQAVQIASRFQQPVSVTLTREEDLGNDYYRPATRGHLSASLDPAGRPIRWQNLFIAPMKQAEASVPPYQVGELTVDPVQTPHELPTGNWRSVDYSFQTFFTESFIDELAHNAESDVLQFRRELLPSGSRLLAPLQRLQTIHQSGQDREGSGTGIAIQSAFGTHMGLSVTVQVDDDRLEIQQINCIVDCGRVIHPDSARAQVEGSILFGLSAALMEEIRHENGRVEQDNFDSYALLRIHQVPELHIEFVDSGLPPGGLGEPATALVAPALCNAIYAASSLRIRELPVSRHLQV